MVEKLKEAKELIKAGKYDEAISIIDEVIANTPEPTGDKNENSEVPLPGEGQNGKPAK